MYDNLSDNLSTMLNHQNTEIIYGIGFILLCLLLLLMICLPDLICTGMKRFKKWEKEEEVKERMIEYGIKQKLEEKDK